jgi:hypothetical protein
VVDLKKRGRSSGDVFKLGVLAWLVIHLSIPNLMLRVKRNRKLRRFTRNTCSVGANLEPCVSFSI